MKEMTFIQVLGLGRRKIFKYVFGIRTASKLSFVDVLLTRIIVSERGIVTSISVLWKQGLAWNY